MILKLLRDMRGATLVEFSVTLPLFLVLMFGLLQAALLLWTQAGLQHGVEVATRCASVNYSANQLGSPVATTPSCFGVTPSTVCGSPPGCDIGTATPYIQAYALQNSFGLVPTNTVFNVQEYAPVSGQPCPINVGTNASYLVTASAPYNLLNYIFSLTLTARSQFSISCS